MAKKAMLVCNQQKTLHISDTDQVEEDISKFYALASLIDKGWVKGSWCLLGEQPTSPLLV